jgi:hypothetical protein
LEPWSFDAREPPGRPAEPPVNLVPPIIGCRVGEILATDRGAWTNNPTSFVYQWRRDGADIVGGTGMGYLLTAADEGAVISVAVVADNAGGARAPRDRTTSGRSSRRAERQGRDGYGDRRRRGLSWQA